MGDPQAPLRTFLGLLHRRGLLGADGRLRPDVQLVSMGDHFDYGTFEERESVARQSAALFAWLCAHPPDQVIVLLGNHDLARVCELHGWTAERYGDALMEAASAYRGGDVDTAAEAEFLKQYPMFPTAELVARDCGSFHPAQSRLVLQAIAAGRVKLAHAEDERTLLVHAGVTPRHLRALGLSVEEARAKVIARALNALLGDRFARRGEGPLDLSPLHVPGSAETGEGVGMFFHRAAHPSRIEGRADRKFDARDLPRGLVQVVGHVRDAKSRKLLGPWCDAPEGEDGPLRQLTVEDDASGGARVHYAVGLRPASPGAAVMIFTDGSMQKTSPERFELLDLDARIPA